jgi:hypothetical protein
MRSLIYADLHATVGHEPLYTDPTKSLQIWRVKKFYADLLKIYTDNHCDTLFDLGDTFDDRSSIPVPAIDTVCEGLSKFPVGQWNIKLVGNHEQYIKNALLSVARLFEPYFTTVTTPTVISYGRVNIVCVPYPSTDGSLTAFLDSMDRTKPTVFLGHFQLSGSFTHGEQLMTGVSLEALKWVKLGLLGHIHSPQSFGNIHYVGSPFQQNWGETGEDKRVAIVDISEQSGQVSLKWVPLTGYPEYLEVDLDTFTATARSDSEHRFRVRLKSPREAATFYAHPLTTHGDPQYDFDVSATTTETDVELEGDTWTPENVVRRYVEHNKPSDKGIAISAQELTEIGVGLLTP